MNGNITTNHTRFVVACIAFLGTLCLIGGTLLIYKGYSGDLVIGGGLAAISGLIGMLSNRQPSQDVVKISNPPTEPVPVAPQPQEHYSPLAEEVPQPIENP